MTHEWHWLRKLWRLHGHLVHFVALFIPPGAASQREVAASNVSGLQSLQPSSGAEPLLYGLCGRLHASSPDEILSRRPQIMWSFDYAGPPTSAQLLHWWCSPRLLSLLSTSRTIFWAAIQNTISAHAPSPTSQPTRHRQRTHIAWT